MSLTDTGVKLFVAKVLSTIVLFAGLAYFARELTPAIMGSFFLFRTLSDGIALVSDFGIRTGVQKRLSEGENPESIISSGMLMKILSLIAFSIVVLLLQTSINQYLGSELAVYLVVSIIARELGWFGVDVLRGERRVDETATVEASRLVVWILVSLLLLSVGYQILAVVYGFIAGQVAFGLFAFYRMDTSFGRPSSADARSIISYSKYDFVSKMSDYVYNWLDIAIIGYFLTQDLVGIYEYAWQMTLPVALIMETIVTVLFPQISYWHSSESTDEIPQVISIAISAGLFIAIPAFVGSLVLAEPILLSFFGPAYTAGALVLVILMGEKVVSSVQSVLNMTLRGIDKPRDAAISTGATLFSNLSLNILLVPQLGIQGAAIATFGSVCLSAIFHWYFLNKYIPTELPLNITPQVAAIAIAMGGVVFAVDAVLTINTLFELLPVVGLGVVTYLGCAYLLPSLRGTIVQPMFRAILPSD